MLKNKRREELLNKNSEFDKTEIFEMHDEYTNFYIYNNPDIQRVVININSSSVTYDPKKIKNKAVYGAMNILHHKNMTQTLKSISEKSQADAFKEYSRLEDLKGTLNIYDIMRFENSIAFQRMIQTPLFILKNGKTPFKYTKDDITRQEKLFEGYKLLHEAQTAGLEYLKAQNSPDLEECIKEGEEARYQSQLIIHSKKNHINAIVENGILIFPHKKDYFSRKFVTN
jgi:hypothetical protein